MKCGWKKALSLLLCGALALTVLAACGPGDASNGGTTYGRYVEQDVSPEDIKGYAQQFMSYGGGKLDLITNEWGNTPETRYQQTYRRWNSSDGGSTWTSVDMSWTEQYINDYSEYYDRNETPPEEINLGSIIPMENGGALMQVYTYTNNTDDGSSSYKNEWFRVTAAGETTPYAFSVPADMAARAEGRTVDTYPIRSLPGGRVLVQVSVQPNPEDWEDPSFKWDWEANQKILVCNMETGETLYELPSQSSDVVYNATTLYVYDWGRGYTALNLADGSPANAPMPPENMMQQLMQMGTYNMFVDNNGSFYTVNARGVNKYAASGAPAPAGGSAASSASAASAAPLAGTSAGGAPADGAPEKVMDGINYTYGSPLYSVSNIVYDTDSESILMLVFENSRSMDIPTGKLLRYTWDENAVATSDNRLHVYSLYDNYSVRLGLSQFKRENPDVTIEYETAFNDDNNYGGMAVSMPAVAADGAPYQGSDTGQTVEDAIRALNTELVAGTGPDVLILDGLPIDSLIARGVLQDLSSVVQGNNDLIAPVIDSMRRDGKLYAIPSAFYVPTLFGEAGYVEQFKDLDTLVAAIEAGPIVPPEVKPKDPDNWTQEEIDASMDQYAPKPTEEQPVLRFSNVSEVFEAFYATSASALFGGQGGINQEALTSFLQAVKAISDKYNLSDGGFGGNAVMGTSSGYASYSLEQTAYSFSNRQSRLGYANLGSPEMLSMIASNLYYSANQDRFGKGVMMTGSDGNVMDEGNAEPEPEKLDDIIPAYIPAPGLATGTYIPRQMVGVTATAAKPELARAFVAAMLGNDVQNNDLGNGFPVTRGGLDIMKEYYDTQSTSYFADMGITRIPFDYEALTRGLTTPFFANEYLKQAIFKPIAAYCAGTLPLDAAINQINSETELYFAERQ